MWENGEMWDSERRLFNLFLPHPGLAPPPPPHICIRLGFGRAYSAFLRRSLEHVTRTMHEKAKKMHIGAVREPPDMMSTSEGGHGRVDEVREVA